MPERDSIKAIPPGEARAPRDLAGPAPPDLPDIREKAERIVSLLSGIDGCDGQADYNLSLAEELAQEIADLCPTNGSRPLT